MTAHRKQLLIGLDAAEWDLIRRWAEEGKLPTFRRLIDEGYSAELTTTAAQLPDTVSSCIYSGTNPAKFQKYFYIQYDSSRGDLRNVSDDEIHAVPFWRYFCEAGRKVIVADIPKSPITRDPNCIHLSNWGSHAAKMAYASNPPPLASEVLNRFGKHPVGQCDAVDAKLESLRSLRLRIVDGVKAHGDLFTWLMASSEWDLFFCSFSAPHCIGHHFWQFMDKGVPGISDAIESTYAAMDREIGRLMREAGPDALTYVVAGHGMGSIHHASWNLSEILDLLGYGKRPMADVQKPERDATVNPWRILKMVIPGKVQYAIKAMLPKRLQDELLFRWYAGSRDWAGRRAFAVPNNESVGAIRVNVKGRDKHGIVNPGADYQQICQDITAALSELVDPETGRKVVKRVTISSEAFHGPYLDNLPDLTVLWEQGFAWSSVRSDRIGTLRISRQDGRSGSHTPHGFLLVHGSGVQTVQAQTQLSILDVAPTILADAGISIPADMDGSAASFHLSTPPMYAPISLTADIPPFFTI
jgi:predicted AlkP superfamily phosphohydrolase/phosphomutase